MVCRDDRVPFPLVDAKIPAETDPHRCQYSCHCLHRFRNVNRAGLAQLRDAQEGQLVLDAQLAGNTQHGRVHLTGENKS